MQSSRLNTASLTAKSIISRLGMNTTSGEAPVNCCLPSATGYTKSKNSSCFPMEQSLSFLRRLPLCKGRDLHEKQALVRLRAPLIYFGRLCSSSRYNILYIKRLFQRQSKLGLISLMLEEYCVLLVTGRHKTLKQRRLDVALV